MNRSLQLRVTVALVAAAMAAFPANTPQAQANVDPFTFFQPTIRLTPSERQDLDRGETLVRVLPGSEGEIAVFAALPIRIDGNRLVAWVRRIADLKKSRMVRSIGRFSDPPKLADLRALSLDDSELNDLRRCRPGACAFKLSEGEIDRFQQVMQTAGDGWRTRAQEALRFVVLGRVQRYLAGGPAALPPSADRQTPVSPSTVFSRLMEHSAFLTGRLPDLTAFMDRPSHSSPEDLESFVYWSEEQSVGRPVVSATQVNVVRGDGRTLPDALVASAEIFSTHYTNGSLSVTAVLRGRPGATNYLVYLNRSTIDVLDGPFGSLKRRLIEHRVKADASHVLEDLRRRLESGEPGGRP